MRTANAADRQLSALVTANAPDVSAVPDGGWFLIAPYGSHPSPDQSYMQVFTRAQADKVVRTWNSLAGSAARWFKNLSHGLGGKFSSPIWDGHPETDKGRWPAEQMLGEVTDLRATDAGLEGQIAWRTQNGERRTKGPLYPSPLWWHWPKDKQHRVFPELLESIGLVDSPNISDAPAWTHNAKPDPATAEVLTTQHAETQIDSIMDRKALARKLGLDENATDEQIMTKLGEVMTTANSATENIRTANSSRDAAQADVDRLRGELATANGLVSTKGGEITTLTTANSQLTTQVGELAGAVVHGFELAGVTLPADRETLAGKLTANSTAAATVAELKARRAVLPIQKLELGANRLDISTANARKAVLDAEIAKRTANGAMNYDQAFAACEADPALKPLFDAMAPSKTSA